MAKLVELNVDAVYNGYHVTFTHGKYEYDMETKLGNKGRMVIRLISIDEENNEFNWRYVEKNDVFTFEYVTITRTPNTQQTKTV